MYELTTMWRGLPQGTPIDAFPWGMIDILLQRGIARKVDNGSDNAKTDSTDQQNGINKFADQRGRRQATPSHRADRNVLRR